MSAQIDDGGPAFPSPGFTNPNGEWQYPVCGMTLRDWFATHATEEDINAHIGGTVHPQTGRLYGCRTREAAKYAYADEMVRARKGGAE